MRGRSQLDLCAVGITPYLVDPKTGETLKKGRPLTGIERISVRAAGRSWQSFSPSERATILAYCQSAHRRAISQAFVELEIVD